MHAREMRRTRPSQSARPAAVAGVFRFATGCVFLLSVATGIAGCGVAERPHAAEGGESATTHGYSWPAQDFHLAVLELKDRGEIHLALYPQLAPENVESFASRAEEGFYDGVTFHRVIKDFMIQTGDPLSRDEDPANDGRGGLDQSLTDEFSDAPFLRGVVALANEGREDSGGSQFFIMHQDQRGLDGRYTVLGRVTSGIHLVDDVALTETDIGARWGPLHRPLEDIFIERIRIERASDRLAKSGPAAAERSDGAEHTKPVKPNTLVADTKP
jgi:peptidyl-prolyl cis-trans isomerase B (cyclophilin B)